MKKLNVNEVLSIVNSAIKTRAEENNQDKKETIVITKDQINTDFSELDIDSITFISIVVSLEGEYEIEIPDEYLLMTEMNNIMKIFQVLKDVIENQIMNEDTI
ncbi:MAG: acyl carrier protein [Oscillospiraceae bacterium]|nr:acyl carrier protein [Oscillospiraceae bacterium]